MAQINSDERLRKNAGGEGRTDRGEADTSRTNKDGTALTAEERKARIREDWVQSKLPQAPGIPGYHTCWLSTTNGMDTIQKRMQNGYIPVLSSEVRGFAGPSVVAEGEFQGVVSCNEMLLFKIEDQIYQDIMSIFHYDMPMEAERSIYDKVHSSETLDNSGRRLDIVEGDFNAMGQRTSRAPKFD